MTRTTRAPTTRALLDVTRIYAEPAAAASLRQQVIERWPAAELVEVASHRQSPELHGEEANVALRIGRDQAET